jgi:hypothetical protein
MDIKVGDRVTPVPDERAHASTLGAVFIVEKINPRNVRCSADGGRGINYPADMLVPATDENIEAGRRFFGGTIPYREHFSNGEIVTLTEPYKGITSTMPLIVFKDDGGNYVNLVILGGDGSRYLRMPPRKLVRRDLAWLTEHLVEVA